MKSLIIGLVVISSITSSFANTEIVCDSGTSTAAKIEVNEASPKSINLRIQELQKQGKKVEVKHLTSSAGGYGYQPTDLSDHGRAVLIDRICAVLTF